MDHPNTKWRTRFKILKPVGFYGRNWAIPKRCSEFAKNQQFAHLWADSSIGSNLHASYKENRMRSSLTSCWCILDSEWLKHTFTTKAAWKKALKQHQKIKHFGRWYLIQILGTWNHRMSMSFMWIWDGIILALTSANHVCIFSDPCDRDLNQHIYRVLGTWVSRHDDPKMDKHVVSQQKRSFARGL